MFDYEAYRKEVIDAFFPGVWRGFFIASNFIVGFVVALREILRVPDTGVPNTTSFGWKLYKFGFILGLICFFTLTIKVINLIVG